VELRGQVHGSVWPGPHGKARTRHRGLPFRLHCTAGDPEPGYADRVADATFRYAVWPIMVP
jgi:hypothetical protein